MDLFDLQALAKLYDYLEKEVGVDVKHKTSTEAMSDLIDSHRRLVEELKTYREQILEEAKNLRLTIMEKYIKDAEFISREKLSEMTITEIDEWIGN